MGRTQGAVNKRSSDGIKLLVGVGVGKPKVNPKVVPKEAKVQRGTSSTQGRKPGRSGYPI